MLFDVGGVMIVPDQVHRAIPRSSGWGDDADLHSILLLVIDGHSI
jgi:hypothetical protein